MEIVVTCAIALGFVGFFTACYISAFQGND